MTTETEILDRVREIVLASPDRLDMDTWHGGDGDEYDPAVECLAECGTTHCLAGWAQVLSGQRDNPKVVGERLLPKTCRAISLYASNRLALAWLAARGYADGVDFAAVVTEYERRGGRVIRDDGDHVVVDGDAIVLGGPACRVTQSGGEVRTCDSSAPSITQSGGVVRTFGSSAPSITRVSPPSAPSQNPEVSA